MADGGASGFYEQEGKKAVHHAGAAGDDHAAAERKCRTHVLAVGFPHGVGMLHEETGQLVHGESVLALHSQDALPEWKIHYRTSLNIAKKENIMLLITHW